MPSKPKSLTFIAWSLLFVALSMPAQVFLLYGHGPQEIDLVLNKLSFLNWIVVVGAMCTAVLVERVSKWALWAVPIWMIAAGVNNAFVGYFGTDFTLTQSIIATASLVMILSPIYRSSILKLFIQPEQRWWLRAERKKIQLPICVSGSRKVSLLAETHDISSSGAFLTCDTELLTDDELEIDLNFGIEKNWRCRARVARRAAPSGSYPMGIGLSFIDVKPSQRRELERLIETAQPL